MKLRTDRRFWLSYEGYIVILKKNGKGKRVRFQYGGTSCLQADFKCELVDRFSSKSKWFNEDWWYKRTVWGDAYPSKVYFDEKEYDFDNEKSFFEEFSTLESVEKAERKRNKEGNNGAIPSEEILNEIIEEVNKNTKSQYEIDFDNIDYGVNWWEAYIPIKNKAGKKFILSWMNCD